MYRCRNKVGSSFYGQNSARREDSPPNSVSREEKPNAKGDARNEAACLQNMEASQRQTDNVGVQPIWRCLTNANGTYPAKTAFDFAQNAWSSSGHVDGWAENAVRISLFLFRDGYSDTCLAAGRMIDLFVPPSSETVLVSCFLDAFRLRPNGLTASFQEPSNELMPFQMDRGLSKSRGTPGS